MIYSYNGNYSYNEETVGNWNSSAIGVYYCGIILANGNLRPLYIGSGTGDNGIKGRLLDHLRENYWSNVTHFGYQVCDTTDEARKFETEEIDRYKPKYNKVGK